MRPTCAVDGCDEPVGYGRRVYCTEAHALNTKRAQEAERYQRWTAIHGPRRWVPKPPSPRRNLHDVDPVAVLRAVRGDPVELNRGERRAAVAVLTRRGMTAAAIGRQLGIHGRSVVRERAAIRNANRKQAA